jgi:transmembrane sensor
VTAIGLTVHRSEKTDVTPPSSVRTYTTGPGQHAVISLSRGVHATLGSATSLVVSTEKTGTTMTVNGQALFDVSHHDRYPLSVRTGALIARVLGTTFYVRHYPTDSVAQVVVLDGRVAVSDTLDGTPVPLSARMRVIKGDSTARRVTPRVNTDDYTGWTTGQLVFRQAAITDIVAELGRVYDADIRLSEKAFANDKLTWTVPVLQRSLADVLDALTVQLHAHVVRAGRVITIVPGRPVRRVPTLPSLSPTSESQYGR